MRIISGSHKGRRLVAPGNLPVRPTTDFAKEALFNILNNLIDFEEVKFLDLFAGTGNISFEMASRGCENITSVDEHAGCYKFIKETAEQLKFKGITAYRMEVFHYLDICSEKFDLIFADPPFEFDKTHLLPKIIFEKKLLNEGGYLIIEHPKSVDLSKEEHFFQHRKYGKVNFSVFH